MSRMAMAGPVTVPPGGAVTFAPGGYHLMCMEPSAEIKPGSTASVTLTFANGSSVTAPFAVRSASGH